MQFAEEFLTDKKGDSQHNPSVNSYLVRIPGTINSKCRKEVKLKQRWDGQRPAIQYLLHDFRRWLINQRLEQSRSANKTRSHISNSTTIQCIERLLQTPLNDYRKFVIWHVQHLTLLTLENTLLMRLWI